MECCILPSHKSNMEEHIEKKIGRYHTVNKHVAISVGADEY
jgi:hypothetical protein